MLLKLITKSRKETLVFKNKLSLRFPKVLENKSKGYLFDNHVDIIDLSLIIDKLVNRKKFFF